MISCGEVRSLTFLHAFILVQEENKLLERTHRQKIVEVEKLTQTIHELEESILAGGGAANAVRDYRRQVAELNVRF